MIKLSNSSISTYRTCARKYYLQYVEKLSGTALSSALIFGVAIDLSLNDVLLNHGKKSDDELIKIGIDTFNKAWQTQENKYEGPIVLDKNPNILYTKKDFDESLLTTEDQVLIDAYFEELDFEAADSVSFFEALRQQPFGSLDEKERSFHNYVVWLAVKRKAPYLIKAYVQDLLPHVDKVHSIQLDLTTEDEEGNKLTGIVDFLVQLKPGTYGSVEVVKGEPIVADNKTSGKLYAKDSVETSSQLAKYKVILNERGIKINKGAYFVVLKELKRVQNKTCVECGHKTTKTVKKCDNIIAGKRCNGEFTTLETFQAQTQLVVDDIPFAIAESSMQEVDDVIQLIKDKQFDPDYTQCDWQFGSPCVFREHCRTGSMKGLVKRK